MHRLRPRVRISEDHALDAQGAHRGAAHLQARGLPAHLERTAAQLRPKRGQRALGPDPLGEEEPAAMSELWRLTAAEAVARLRKREVSPLELVDAAASRIEAIEP